MRFNKMEIKNCELCGEPFEYNPKNKRSSNRRFCSLLCAQKNNGLNNKDRRHTDEWKKMMSDKNKGENNPFYGKVHSVESLAKMSKSSQWDESKYKYCNISKDEKEIIDGILISDGSISASRISGRLSIISKYQETIDRIISDLPSIEFLKPWRYESKLDKRTSKSYTNYQSKSLYYHNLLSEYNRWYKNGVKIIPSDINITPLMCYWWFVGDGYNINDNVYLCTDSFDNESINLVNEKLKKLGFKTSIRPNNRIFFDKKSSIVFLDWISKNIEIQKEYLYKWKK